MKTYVQWGVEGEQTFCSLLWPYAPELWFSQMLLSFPPISSKGQEGYSWVFPFSPEEKVRVGDTLFPGSTRLWWQPQWVRLWLASFTWGYTSLRRTVCWGIFKMDFFSPPLPRSRRGFFWKVYCENLLEILKEYCGSFYLRGVYDGYPAIYQLPSGFLHTPHPRTDSCSGSAQGVSTGRPRLFFQVWGSGSPSFSFSRAQEDLLGFQCVQLFHLLLGWSGDF